MRSSEQSFDPARTYSRLGQALCAQIADAFRQKGAFIDLEDELVSPQALIDRDDDLLDCVLAKHQNQSNENGVIIRLWRNERVLVVPKSFRNRKGFADAVNRCGIPVILRRSGGSAVIHGPHVLNVSVAVAPTRPERFNIAKCYAQLGSAILPHLNALGVDARLDDVAAAHCPGRYCIVSNARKLGGTAAFTRHTQHGLAAVVHASLSLWSDARDIAEISTFDRMVGIDAHYEEVSHVSLEEAYTLGKD